MSNLSDEYRRLHTFTILVRNSREHKKTCIELHFILRIRKNNKKAKGSTEGYTHSRSFVRNSREHKILVLNCILSFESEKQKVNETFCLFRIDRQSCTEAKPKQELNPSNNQTGTKGTNYQSPEAIH